jgi:hypothetical protein
VNQIVAILLFPPVNDPAGLLAAGAPECWDYPERALVLAWEGRVEPRGCARVRQAVELPDASTLLELLQVVQGIPPELGRVVLLARDDEGNVVEFP